MTDWNLDDIEGLPDTVPELRAWVGKARALWRNWADCKPIPTPEAGFKKAAGYMDELRKHLGMPTAEEDIAAMRATSSTSEVVGESGGAKSATVALTLEAVRDGKFSRISTNGAVTVSRSNACDRLTMVRTARAEGDLYQFTVDAGRLGERDFTTVGEAVDWINAMPGVSK